MPAKKTEGSKTKFLDFLSFRRKQGDEEDGEEMVAEKEEDITRATVEQKLEDLANSYDKKNPEANCSQWNVGKIVNIVTAKNLCSCKDPITMAFKVNCTLRKFAKTYTENTELLKKLANQTEDFAVELIGQVHAKEELVIRDEPENVDRYASLLSAMTDDAIVHSQKKFVAHPLLYKRLKMRWNLGLPNFLQRHSVLLLIIILIDTFLTPFLVPFVGFAFLVDLKKYQKRLRKAKTREQNPDATPLFSRKQLDKALDRYYGYFTNPFVIFVKDKLSQLVFIVLHCRVCVFPLAVEPRIEEYLIFVFSCGIVLSECQQYKASPFKYFKDMWNFLDIITLIVYSIIVTLRIITVVRGGSPYNNRLLEIVNYLYGINTSFVILRLSSMLALSSVFGPLQLALFRMCVDLFTIIIQFCFVILAFAMAITKSNIAEKTFLKVPGNHSEAESVPVYQNLFRTTQLLVWSVFGLTELDEVQTSYFVGFLYCVFLVLSVIMLINMLVALLTRTYDNVTTNSEVEWKFQRAVVENQYRCMHSFVVPFNLLTVPMKYLGLRGGKDARVEEAEKREKQYSRYYQERLFPVITERYREKYGGSFPLSIEEKIDLIMEKFNISPHVEGSSDRQVAIKPEENRQQQNSRENLLSVVDSTTLQLNVPQRSKNHSSQWNAGACCNKLNENLPMV